MKTTNLLIKTYALSLLVAAETVNQRYIIAYVVAIFPLILIGKQLYRHPACLSALRLPAICATVILVITEIINSLTPLLLVSCLLVALIQVGVAGLTTCLTVNGQKRVRYWTGLAAMGMVLIILTVTAFAALLQFPLIIASEDCCFLVLAFLTPLSGLQARMFKTILEKA